MTDQTATLDDGASAPALSPLARLKLSRELATIKTDLSALAAGTSSPLARLKLVARANQIRTQLGGTLTPAPAIKPEPEPEPAPPVADPVEPTEPVELGTLRDVVAGLHDGSGLDALLSLIEKAAHSLHGAGLLIGDAEALAHDAVTHWARLELQTNG